MAESGTKKSILVVEDDEDTRIGLTELLEGEGFDVTAAINGADGLERLRAKGRLRKPQLILLDLAMPIKNGVEFRLEQSKDVLFSEIPVILISADSPGLLKAEKLGFSACFKKPLEIEQLMNKITQLCN